MRGCVLTMLLYALWYSRREYNTKKFVQGLKKIAFQKNRMQNTVQKKRRLNGLFAKDT